MPIFNFVTLLEPCEKLGGLYRKRDFEKTADKVQTLKFFVQID